MKSDIHPKNYRAVIFHDNSSNADFLIWTTLPTEETGTFEGKEYPLYKVEVTSESHPFYTGEHKEMDTAGRADKFRKRVAAAKPKKA